MAIGSLHALLLLCTCLEVQAASPFPKGHYRVKVGVGSAIGQLTMRDQITCPANGEKRNRTWDVGLILAEVLVRMSARQQLAAGRPVTDNMNVNVSGGPIEVVQTFDCPTVVDGAYLESYPTQITYMQTLALEKTELTMHGSNAMDLKFTATLPQADDSTSINVAVDLKITGEGDLYGFRIHQNIKGNRTAGSKAGGPPSLVKVDVRAKAHNVTKVAGTIAVGNSKWTFPSGDADADMNLLVDVSVGVMVIERGAVNGLFEFLDGVYLGDVANGDLFANPYKNNGNGNNGNGNANSNANGNKGGQPLQP